MGNDNSAF